MSSVAGGRDEAAPDEAGRQQGLAARARSGPARGSRRPADPPAARPARSPEPATTGPPTGRSRGSWRGRRATDNTVTTTVKAMLLRGRPAMPGSLSGSAPRPRFVRQARRRVTGVTEHTHPEASLESQLETQQLHTEGHDPSVPEAYSRFMRQGWGDRELDLPPHPVASYAAERRRRLAEIFPGERLVLPAGGYKVRSYDTDYRFRADTAHTYFSGNQTSDAVLVVDDGDAVLYARPRSAARHRRVLPGPAVRRAVGRPPAVGARDLLLARHRGAPHRRPGRRRSPAPARPACCAASTRASTPRSRPTSRPTPTSPASSPRCG